MIGFVVSLVIGFVLSFQTVRYRVVFPFILRSSRFRCTSVGPHSYCSYPCCPFTTVHGANNSNWWQSCPEMAATPDYGFGGRYASPSYAVRRSGPRRTRRARGGSDSHGRRHQAFDRAGRERPRGATLRVGGSSHDVDEVGCRVPGQGVDVPVAEVVVAARNPAVPVDPGGPAALEPV